MDFFDDIFPFIIFLIFIMGPILKKIAGKAQTQKGENSPAKSKGKGLFAVLRERLEELAEEARKQKGQSGAVIYDDEGVFDGMDTPSEAPKSVAPAPKPRPSIPRIKAAAPMAVPKHPLLRGLSGQGLRQAVIWSEIIGPPKALRNTSFMERE